MTARVVLSCDGKLPSGMECRGAIPVGAVLTGSQARYAAGKQGWSSNLIAFPPRDFQPIDLCPACTKRKQEGKA
jgi:hypothetical protein